MEADEQRQIAHAVAAAEQLLSASSDRRVDLTDPRPIVHGTRNRIVRCGVGGGVPDLPPSIILKEPRGDGYEPDTLRSPAYEVLNDWAGTQFVSSCSKLAPGFLAGDRSTGLIVIEDLGDIPHVYDVLKDRDPMAAREALVAFARGVGELHAATHDRIEEFSELRRQLGPTRSTMHERLRRSLDSLREALESIQVALPAHASEEIDEVVEWVGEPGAFLTFLHGDMCPVNGLLATGGLRLLDFEFCHVGNALLDLVPMLTSFSICGGGGRVPEPIIEEMERAYRAALAVAVPAAADDAAFELALARASAVSVIVTVGGPFPALSLKPALQRDFEWGPATPRQRIITRIDMIGALLSERGHLPAMQALVEGVGERLKALWPQASGGMGYFPAFVEGPAS